MTFSSTQAVRIPFSKSSCSPVVRAGSDDEISDFVEKNLRLFHDNVSQTIHITILDDSKSEMKQLQEVRHFLVTHNAILGCHRPAFIKA